MIGILQGVTTVALNVGSDFKQRWLNAPQAVRQAFIDDLSRVTEVLQPNTNTEDWLKNNAIQQQHSEQNIIQAYAERKAQLIEEARIRRQKILEQALLEKRANEQAYIEQLKQDELNRFQAQTLALKEIRDHLQHEVTLYASQYHKLPEASTQIAIRSAQLNPDLNLELDNIRLRLELEAEVQIEQSMIDFRAKLKAAALEEIEYILEQTRYKLNQTPTAQTEHPDA